MDLLEPSDASSFYLASDLEWVIYSPPLVNQVSIPDLSNAAQNREIIEQVRRNPSDLITFLKQMKRQTLGTYFEYLVFFWLDQLQEVTLLETNLQVQHDKKTLGEFDCLFTYQGQAYHWELAVKFYANIGNGRDERNWVGPLKRDNLEKKLNRLFDHQLCLGQTDAAGEMLSERGIPALNASPFVKGVLFEKSGTDSPRILPKRISSACTLSHWCTLKELPHLRLSNASYYCCLYKPRWISSVATNDWQNIETINSLVSKIDTLFENDPVPVLIAFGRGTTPDIEECARLFIMPDGWIA